MATATIPLKGSASMESKKVSISSKRQITIPQKFFTLLGFNTEAECIMRGNELVLRPVKENTSGEFAEQILADLIRQGYSGEELLEKFKQTQRKSVRQLKQCFPKQTGSQNLNQEDTP